jgi:hypothetical protein
MKVLKNKLIEKLQIKDDTFKIKIQIDKILKDNSLNNKKAP